MRKSKFLFLLLSIVLVVAFVAVGCTNEEKSEYTLELNKNTSAAFYDAASDAYVFTQGEIDWTVFSFFVYDGNGSMVDTVKVTDSMISPEDKAKVANTGTNTVTIVYQGAKLYITLKILPKTEVVYYTVTYNAGKGSFQGSGIETETDADGNTLYKVEYADGLIDILEQPVRAGYDFVGWYVSDNFTGAKVVAPYTVTRDTVFYAKWSDQRKYTVQYVSYLEDIYNGEVSRIDGIEHGNEITLISAPTRTEYDFKGYYILEDGAQFDESVTPFIPADAEDKTVSVTSDTVVRLYYETKIISLTYISQAWNESTEVYGVHAVYKSNVTVYEDKHIDGWCYVAEVPYGQELTSGIKPVPAFPQLENSTGKWIDTATGKEPVYGKATKDMVVLAVYEVKTYTISFYYDENFAEPVLDNNNRPIVRTAEYGNCVDTVPPTPEKTGYTGKWMSLNSEGYFVETDIAALVLYSDVKVYVKYTPNTYEVRFYYTSGSNGEEIVKVFLMDYGTVIEDVPEDLDEEIKADYDPKYYDIEWYSTRGHDHQVTFPWTVTGNTSFYASPVAYPYTVAFRVVDVVSGEELVFETKSVTPGGYILPPEIIFDESSPNAGYEITGWRTRDFDKFTVYDASKAYVKGDSVYYNGNFYYCLANARGIAPANGAYWQLSDEGTWKNYLYANIGDTGIQINDFHEYNADPLYDKAFYPILQAKEYSVTFMNMSVKGDASSGYENVFSVAYECIFKYGNQLVTNQLNEAQSIVFAAPPEYSAGEPSEFVFDGWYTDPEFVTAKADFTSGYYYFTSDTVFYARWIDKLRGTDGLVYAPQYAADGETVVAYTVVGFKPAVAEYSYIDVRIPENHNNLPVTAIADNAFADFGKTVFVTSVSLPANLASIGDNAFAALFALESFELSEGSAFVFENGVLYSSDRTVLYRCVPAYEHPATFVLPDSVAEIKGGAFAYCSAITNFTADASASALTAIGAYAFDGCENLLRVTLPDGLEAIGAYAFRGCYKLENVYGGDGLRNVGYAAFDDVSKALTLSADGRYLSVGKVLVSYLGNDETLVLSDEFTAIAAGAFADCSELVSITVGATSKLVYIGERAFDGAFGLNSIIFESISVKIKAAEDAFYGISLSATLSVNANLLDEYRKDIAYSFVFGESIFAI